MRYPINTISIERDPRSSWMKVYPVQKGDGTWYVTLEDYSLGFVVDVYRGRDLNELLSQIGRDHPGASFDPEEE